MKLLYFFFYSCVYDCTYGFCSDLDNLTKKKFNGKK